MSTALDWWERLAGNWAAWMWTMTWQVALLAAVVWVLTRFLSKSGAAFRYALWMLVFVKLVLPPVLAAPWSVGTLAERLYPAAHQEPPAITGSAATVIPEPEPPSLQPAPLSFESLTAPRTDTPIPAPAEPPPPHTPPYTPGLALVAMVLWMTVSVAMLATLLYQGLRYRNVLLRDLRDPDGRLPGIIRAQAERLGLRRAFTVKVGDHIRIPAVTGFLRPMVLLPARLVDVLDRD